MRSKRQWIEDPRSKERYWVGNLLGTSKRFNLYECEPAAESRPCILKVATAAAENAALDREAFLLRLMADYASDLENKNRKEKPFNYGNFFPALIGTFIPQGQDGRRMSVLGFPPPIKELSQLVPVSALSETEKVWVDPRTAAWIVGKLLKIADFAHEQGIAVGSITGRNVLIERELHGVVLFDWTQASTQGSKRVSDEIARGEIAHIARIGVAAMGGDVTTGALRVHEQLSDGRLEALLKEMLSRRMANAHDAHTRFYELIYGLWPRGFHPFTTIPHNADDKEGDAA